VRVGIILLLALSVCISAPAEAADPWTQGRHDARNSGQAGLPGPWWPAAEWTVTEAGTWNTAPLVDVMGRIYLSNLTTRKLYAFSPNGIVLWTKNQGGLTVNNGALDATGRWYVGEGNVLRWYATANGNLLGSHDAGGTIESALTIADDGRIFFSTFSAAAKRFYCFDPSGGNHWQYTLGDGVTGAAGVGSDGTAYVGSRDGSLYAFDLNGSLSWSTDIGSPIEAGVALDILDNIYFVAGNNRLYSVDSNGGIRWSSDIGNTVTAAPAVDLMGSVYVVSWDRRIYKYDTNGNRLWWKLTNGRLKSPPSLDNQGRVYFASDDGNIYRVTADGSDLVSTHVGGQFSASGAIAPGSRYVVAIHGNRLLTFGEQPTVTPTPTITDTPEFTFTPTITPTASPSPTASPTSTGVTTTSTPTFTPTETPVTLPPTETPTVTPTRTPTRQPTTPPVRKRPLVFMAGYMNSNLTYSRGGALEMLCWVNDPNGFAVQLVHFSVAGSSQRVALNALDRNLGVFNYWLDLGGGIPPAHYLFEITATDRDGRKSHPWPYLHILANPNAAPEPPPAVETWRVAMERALNGARGPNDPVVLVAGYHDTVLSATGGGTLRIVAAVSDPQNDVAVVRLLAGGQPTGIVLRDDGAHGDFAPNDGVYGYTAPFRPGELAGAVGTYLLEIQAEDAEGNRSEIWPYLWVWP
jgi:hypothetical protein